MISLPLAVIQLALTNQEVTFTRTASVTNYQPELFIASTSATSTASSTIPTVPFYSQFKDINSSTWKKVSCGIASLGMVIEYYQPATIELNALLTEGIEAGAYGDKNGWSYIGLIKLAEKHGLNGMSYDLATSSMRVALSKLTTHLAEGPVIASVHYKFNPKSSIPHLVVITGIENDLVYYNDPASTKGDKTISVDTFTKAWKKRYIVVRPTKNMRVS